MALFAVNVDLRNESYRQLWEARFDELDKVVEGLKRKERVDGRRKK